MRSPQVRQTASTVVPCSSPAFEFGESQVARVRLSVAHFGPHRHLLPPVFDAARAARNEFLIFDDPVVGPNAVGTAEVGDAGFGRNAGARKADYAIRFCDHLDSLVEIHTRIIAQPIDSREPL